MNVKCICTASLKVADQLLCLNRSNGLLLEPLDLVRHSLHAIIVHEGGLLEQDRAAVHRHWDKLTAGLSHDVDGVVVVVVSDQALRLVGCPPADVLRHVHPG